MKKLLLLPVVALAIAFAACSEKPQFNQEASTALITKIQNGSELTQEDYLSMINQTEGALEVFAARLDSAGVDNKAAYDSLMALPPSNPAFSAMFNDCTVFERVLKVAPLDEKTKKAYTKLLKAKQAFKQKYQK